jgi:hypothetical protein
MEWGLLALLIIGVAMATFFVSASHRKQRTQKLEQVAKDLIKEIYDGLACVNSSYRNPELLAMTFAVRLAWYRNRRWKFGSDEIFLCAILFQEDDRVVRESIPRRVRLCLEQWGDTYCVRLKFKRGEAPCK